MLSSILGRGAPVRHVGSIIFVHVRNSDLDSSRELVRPLRWLLIVYFGIWIWRKECTYVIAGISLFISFLEHCVPFVIVGSYYSLYIFRKYYYRSIIFQRGKLFNNFDNNTKYYLLLAAKIPYIIFRVLL